MEAIVLSIDQRKSTSRVRTTGRHDSTVSMRKYEYLFELYQTVPAYAQWSYVMD